MTRQEEIKAKLHSIKEEHKNRFSTKSKKSNKVSIDSGDLLRNQINLYDDLKDELNEIANEYFEIHGVDDNLEINEFIKMCLFDYDEFLDSL